MRFRTTIITLACAATLTTGLTVTAGPASAAGPCGSGYSRVGAYAVPASGTRLGTLEVYYNSGAGKNCALVYGYGSTAGTTTIKGVYIDKANHQYGEWADSDYGSYSSYAGPVYVSAGSGCIDVQGVVKTSDRYLNNVHCG
ncbi:spore-associated protein A [Nonomuraea solani]|nr:spore-associated protein A [Nonomuraea solani]